MPETLSQASHLELAHVLFTDVVGYSKLPMDEQQSTLSSLQQAVRATSEFQSAADSDQLICLPTGDGMALVFFGDPEAPVRCAVELAHRLRSHPEVRLRMGVHSGPVYRIADINANRNVAGGGINIAQRVMDCGDAGHILVSSAVADILSQLSTWKDRLQDLGEAEVKHGVRVHLFNLLAEDAGNPAPPHAANRHIAHRPPTVPRLRGLYLLFCVAILSGIAGAAWWIRSSTTRPAAAPPAAEKTLPATNNSSATEQKASAISPSVSKTRAPVAAAPARAKDKSQATDPPAKQVPQLTGHYAGLVSLSGSGESHASLFLSEEHGVVSGCLQTARSGFGAGPIRGIASRSHVVASVPAAGGRTELQGQIVETDFAGTFTRFAGSEIRHGRFNLRRQSAKDSSANFDAANCPSD